jgi:hypothetical protein
MSGNGQNSWRVLAGQVRGAAHIRQGLPNQDALTYTPKRKPGPPLILVLADGHGSPASFRSALGAHIAVAGALSQIKKIAAFQQKKQEDSIQSQWMISLPERIVTGWQNQAAVHLAQHPFTDEEWQGLREKGMSRHALALEVNPLIAYGTTLLAVLVMPEIAYFLQLGDGDLLVVEESGDVNRLFPADERFIANETTSMCMPQAWKEMRLMTISLTSLHIDLIMASTDGYVNSFRDEASFFKAGQDFLAFLRRYGAPFIRRRLSGWLRQTSRSGSGDDISLGIIYQPNADEPR